MKLARSRSQVSCHAAGFSLIELIVAMALGLILTLGVVQIFLGSKQTYRLTDGISRLQEDMRFALGRFQYEGRMAGHTGCLVGDPASDLNSGHPDYFPYAYDGRAVVGWEADGTGPEDTFAIHAPEASTGWSNQVYRDLPADLLGLVVPGSDVFIINSTNPTKIRLNASSAGSASLGTSTATNVAQNSIVLVVAGDCSGGEIFQKANQHTGNGFTKSVRTSPGNLSPLFRGNYDAEAQVYQYTSTAFYVGEDGTGGTALFMDRLDPADPSGAVTLVEGIENMQVLYGLANSARTQADSYLPASQLAGNDWAEVVSIRIALLMHTEEQVLDRAEADTLNLLGTQVSTGVDRRARLVGSATIGIRNKLK